MSFKNVKYQGVKFYFGDSINLMQDEFEFTLDQIEVNIGKLNKYDLKF